MKKQTFTLLLCYIALTTQASIQRTVSLEGAHFGTGSDVTIEATNIEITEALKLSSGSKLTVIFFAPFGGALDGIYKYKAPQLRYVTDGEENTVIYTAKGGYRLWDNYNGVENVVADGDVGDAADVLYYNLQGQPVSVPQPGGMYIRVDGGRATKVIAK